MSGHGELTVLMTVYNGEPYLRTAIESILNQTYREFRFLIVDDGSTDTSREIVRSYEDNRIELVCTERNVGQTAALNIGLRHATTHWIARMDADDYSAPTRLEEQMKALKEDGSLSCVGTFCWIFHSDPEIVESTWVHPIHPEDIKRGLLNGCPMTHGSIVVSREVMLDIGAYDERYKVAADIELYERLLKRYRAANLPRTLYGCRIHVGQQQWSRLSLEESIEIWTRKPKENDYTVEEASMVRRILADYVVSRVRYLWPERSCLASLKDLFWVFWLAPMAITKRSVRALARLLLSFRVRGVMRGR